MIKYIKKVTYMIVFSRLNLEISSGEQISSSKKINGIIKVGTFTKKITITIKTYNIDTNVYDMQKQ